MRIAAFVVLLACGGTASAQTSQHLAVNPHPNSTVITSMKTNENRGFGTSIPSQSWDNVIAPRDYGQGTTSGGPAAAVPEDFTPDGIFPTDFGQGTEVGGPAASTPESPNPSGLTPSDLGGSASSSPK